MRRIHTFQYYNKTFRAGDLTVEDYWLYLRNPEEAMQKILEEFNEKAPKMSVEHYKKFMRILFSSEESDDDRKRKMLAYEKRDTKKIREEIDQVERDFHIEVGALCITLKQSFSDVIKMPFWLYERFLKDMKILTGQEQMTPGRHKKTIDSAGLKKALKK